jgi:hypothetical protein
MRQALTETERKVVEILTNHEVTADAYKDPIHAVDREMDWATKHTLAFVRDLQARNIVQAVPAVRHGLSYDPKWSWREGEVLSLEVSKLA